MLKTARIFGLSKTVIDERPKGTIEKRKRNSFLQFREKKEIPEIPFTSFERKKRNLTNIFSTLERRKGNDFSILEFKDVI